MIEHALDDIQHREGWAVAVCGCGWGGPPCPDSVTAANFWGQHLLAAHAEFLAEEGVTR